MAEQSVDLRSTLSTLRRHRRVLVLAALLGTVAGVGFVLLRPPMYTSSSLVLLPPAQNSNGMPVTRNVDTEVRVATSDTVLGPAAEALDPPMSTRKLDRRVVVTASTTDVLKIQGRAETAQGAEAIARAVADSEVDYLTGARGSLTNTQRAYRTRRTKELQASLDKVNAEINKTSTRLENETASGVEGQADARALAQLTAQQASLTLQIDQLMDPVGDVQPGPGARVIQDALPAKRPKLVAMFVLAGLAGLVLAVGLAALLLTFLARRDRRLLYRDGIADAVGSPVIASVRSSAARTVAGWTSLLEGYDPGTVDGWALRQALRQLVPDEPAKGPRQPNQGGSRVRHPVSVTVIALSDDPRGLAMGPQIASYAAATGIRTRLVAAQRDESASSLWAACANAAGEEVRPGLRVDTQATDKQGVDLTVVLAVVDRRKPELLELPTTSVTVLALSAGSATAEDLARTAVTCDDADRRIAGIMVADPDDLDRTTGRLMQLERLQQVPLPTRLTGVPTTKSGRPSSSRQRRRQG